MAGYFANSPQTNILQMYFNATAISSICLTSATQGSLWVALHTADPGAGGNQATSETTYTSYARVQCTRGATSTATSTPTWQVTGNSPASASPLAGLFFATCSASSTTIVTNFSVGSSSSGSGVLWFSGPVTQNITITTNVTPSLTTGTAVTLD